MTDPNNIAIDSEANLPSAAYALQQGIETQVETEQRSGLSRISRKLLAGVAALGLSIGAVVADSASDPQEVSANFIDEEGKISANGTRCVNTDAQGDELVFANVTVTQGEGSGFINAHSPNANGLANSTQNHQGNSIANATLINQENGRVCVTANKATHAILDIVGYVDGSVVRSATPSGQADRVLDTRSDGGSSGGSGGVWTPPELCGPGEVYTSWVDVDQNGFVNYGDDFVCLPANA